ncbi:MAG: RidA family protein [Parvibaculales bacterium]
MSNKQITQVKTDPDPFEAFNLSQAISYGDLVFVSGQAALDLDGNIVGAGNFDLQAKTAFENLKTVLEAAGSSMSQVLKVTIYMKDMSQFPKIIALREAYFTKPYPADTIVEVSSLALPELEFEIEAVAALS